VLKAAIEAPVALVFLAFLFAVSPWLGLAGIVGAVLQTFVAWLNERSTQPPLSQANKASMEAQLYADGSLRNAQVIEAMGMLRDIHARWFAKQREFLRLQAVASDRAGVYTALSRFQMMVLSSVMLGLSALLLLNGELNGGGGMIIVSSILGGRVLQPLVQIVTQWKSAVAARDALARIEALLTAVPGRAGQMELPVPRGMLMAENIIAAAPNSQVPILKGISFALNAGEVLAVVGPSASGKTTLARVLMGLWASGGGKARLDGADVFTWDKRELGRHVGYLPQGVELFDGTLAENIARFGPVEPAKVAAAARAVGLHEFIVALPDGYETDLGPEGARLSGGWRQRVGLARALYGDPVFVLLDEPNSSLDEAGDAALNQAISDAKARGTTFVVITHRTSLLPVCDRMMILRDGTVQVQGPRDEVLAALNKQSQEAAARARAAVEAAAQQRAQLAGPEASA
jgi:ATP-binding cassette subfamily C exporter for protease/lipase